MQIKFGSKQNGIIIQRTWMLDINWQKAYNLQDLIFCSICALRKQILVKRLPYKSKAILWIEKRGPQDSQFVLANFLDPGIAALFSILLYPLLKSEETWCVITTAFLSLRFNVLIILLVGNRLEGFIATYYCIFGKTPKMLFSIKFSTKNRS